MNFGLMIIGGIAGAVGIAWFLHLKKLKRHAGVTREAFVAHFKSMGISVPIATTVYDHFQKLGFWKDFMPSPTDSLGGTYRTVDEDLDDTLKEILAGLGLDLPHSGILREWGAPLLTLSDVVRWVDWVATKQNPSDTAQ